MLTEEFNSVTVGFSNAAVQQNSCLGFPQCHTCAICCGFVVQQIRNKSHKCSLSISDTIRCSSTGLEGGVSWQIIRHRSFYGTSLQGDKRRSWQNTEHTLRRDSQSEWESTRRENSDRSAPVCSPCSPTRSATATYTHTHAQTTTSPHLAYLLADTTRIPVHDWN